ncbi:MAG: hypothetical protein JO055_13640 [Alphaproteobacteria bacterium]|nr:hypothetical protein [Alphaproteobacteria bacterium]
MQERMTGSLWVSRCLSAAALALAIVSPASAEWTKDQRAKFIGACVDRCLSTPSLSDRSKATCPTFCACTADEGEKIMTPADFDAVERASAEGRTTAKGAEWAQRNLSCHTPPSTR